MALKKRYVKRVLRKLIFFLLTIALLSLVTSMIVEKRMKINQTAAKQTETEQNLDPNGDPITEPYRAKHAIVTPRHPRPPYQERITEPPFREISWPEDEWDAELYGVSETHMQLLVPRGAKKDWNDYVRIATDAAREGKGEGGAAAYIDDPEQKELEKKLSMENGFNALLSDGISVNRSLPDLRKEA